jgi:hypothetical protein
MSDQVLNEVRRDISVVRGDIDWLNIKRKEVDASLGMLLSRFRMAGKRMPQDEYKNLCRDQNHCKAQILDIERDLLPLKEELRCLLDEEQEHRDDHWTVAVTAQKDMLLEACRAYVDRRPDAPYLIKNAIAFCDATTPSKFNGKGGAR